MSAHNTQEEEISQAVKEFQQAHGKYVKTLSRIDAENFLRFFLKKNGYDKTWSEQAIPGLYNEYDALKKVKASGAKSEIEDEEL